MKKNIKRLLLVVVSLTFICTTCDEKNADDDLCNKKEPLIEGTFVLSAKIQYKDEVPYEGEVKFTINKMYCNGTINGVYERVGDTDADGYYSTGYIYSYKYEHLLDKVEFSFETTEPDNIVKYKYFYIDIQSEEAYTVNQAFEITLPENSGNN